MHVLQDKSIVITRPVDQAKKLGKLLNEAGAKTIDFPLISIVPLNDYAAFDTQIKALDKVDWLIFISSNAVQNAMPRLLDSVGQLPAQVQFAAIGPVTAKALQAYGVKDVLIPEGRFDSESLLSLPEMHNMQGKNVMIVRGVGGRELLANTLRQRGAQVTFAECYQRINPQTDCALIEQKVIDQTCHAIVVTSSEAMRHLIGLANVTDETVSTHWLGRIKICVNHQRVADEASVSGLQLFLADKPGDVAMRDCISRAMCTEK